MHVFNEHTIGCVDTSALKAKDSRLEIYLQLQVLGYNPGSLTESHGNDDESRGLQGTAKGGGRR